MPKIFVLDTNVLLHSAQALESFEENTIVLPMAVIEELDKFKKDHDELGRNARQVIRRLDQLRGKGKLFQGVELDHPTGPPGKLQILTSPLDAPDYGLNMSIKDNQILQVACHLGRSHKNVIFITKDINLRLKADALGLEVMDFENQKVNFDELYSGCRTLSVPGTTIDALYREKEMDWNGDEFFCNEFALFQDEQKPSHSALAVYKNDHRMHLLSSRPDDQVWNIKPRNKEQRMALDLLMDPQVMIVTLVGQAGSGKTLLALAAALEMVLNKNEYERILVSRPIMPLGRDIGFMPGDKGEKLSHWMQPIFDNLVYLMHGGKKEPSDKKIDELISSRKLELEAITYIRGRSIPSQFVIIDEAQNLTPHEVKTIISRAGEGTKMVLTGDPYQIDNPYLDSSSNGLTYAAERLKKLDLHGHVTLYKSERSPLAAAAAEYL
ncbi:MAG: PhoH family protein [Victivallales bacterium]|nr:PhoH family protein [Victivallales bacterium]